MKQEAFDFFREIAMALNTQHGAGWADRATEWCEQNTGVFCSDNVTDAIGMPVPDAEEANKNNAIGAWFNKMSRQGRIVQVDGYASSSKPSSHGASLKMWMKAN